MYFNPLVKSSSSTLSKRGNFNLFSLSSQLSRTGVLQNLFVENLINKKTSVVLVPSMEQAQYLRQCLEEIDLASLSIIIDNDKELEGKDLALLRSAAKLTLTDHKITDYEILGSNMENALKNLSESYGLLNKKIFGERSWRTLSSQKEHFHFHNEVNLVKRKIDLEKISFTQKEYWNIRGRIEEASNTYVSKFGLLQKVDCLSPTLYKADHLDDKVVTLEKLLNKGNNLLMSFGDLIETLSNELKQQGLDELEQLSAMNAAVKHSLTEYTRRNKEKGQQTNIQGKLKSVFSAKSKVGDLTQLRQQVKFLSNEFIESKYFDLELPRVHNESFNEVDIQNIVDNADAVLSKWQIIIRTYTDTKLKQMSPLNSEHHDLKRLDKALSSYLQEINAAEILHEQVEDNTFSLYKKLDLLEATLEKMRTGFAILTENEDYIEWKSMLAYCKEGTHQIIQALVGLPIKYWTRIFDQVFIGDLLDRTLSPRLPKNEVQLEHIDELATEYRSLTIDAIKIKWNIEKEKKLAELKKENKQLYATLVKKNNAVDFSWPKIITRSPDIISALYPIMIVTERAITKIKPLYYKWSECISYNWAELSSPGSILLKSYSLKQTVIEDTDLTEDHKTRVRSYFNSDHILYAPIEGDKLGKVTKTFAQMDNIEKLSKARSLSRILLAANPNLRLFYLRNNSLISTLPDRENSRIVEQLSETGIKEVGPNHELEETMMDMFVDPNKQCVLLTEDGLLNTAEVAFFDWQYHVLKNVKALGCQIVNMWTTDMEASQANLLEAVTDKIITVDDQILEPSLT